MAVEVPAAVEAVWARTRDQTITRIATVEAAVTAMLDGSLDEEQRAAAEREAHKLAGSLGMFGFPRGTELARDLEQGLAPGSTTAPPALAELVLALSDEVETRPVDAASNGAVPATGPIVLLVGPDPDLIDQLSVEAVGRNLQPRSAPTPSAARKIIAEEQPVAAVLDVSFHGDGSAEGLDLIEFLASQDPPVQVIALTGSEALMDRVEVARRGGHGFVQRTRPPARVMEAVSEAIERRDRPKAKVLAVDDDPVISAALEPLLASCGLSTTTLNEPLRFWEVLDEVEPDLVVLDLDMPGLDGVDLCRTLRGDERFSRVPVVFLTGHTDPESVQRIFEAGADDYVTKPVVGPELTTRILNRIERVAHLRDFAECDGLTGVASRRKVTEDLERFVAMSRRFGQPLSVALIDLDRFKSINDRLGHPAGDAALCRLSEMLLDSFRGEDTVGRWGGEEFLIGMYGMGRDDGVQRVAEVLEKFREEKFHGRDGAVAELTFTAGVAEFPRDGADVHELYRAADDALYVGKAGGRNRVVPAGGEVAPDSNFDVVVVEDDPALADVLIGSLETRGYRTRWIDDGAEAVAALAGATPSVCADLVLLDVDLPGVDGLSVLRRLAQSDVLGDTSVIMLTARSAETEVLEALQLGASDHVAKPFSVPVLMQRVRRALQR